MAIELIPLTQFVSVETVLARTSSQRIIVADAYVENAETWQAEAWGWSNVIQGVRIDNVDHHAPVARMQRLVSSGNLAMEFVDACGSASNQVVLINHCDCDSIVAAAILAGLVEPDSRLADAVLAADHTGRENLIADALQALEPARNLERSIETLMAILQHRRFSPEAQIALDRRKKERKLWRKEVVRPNVVQHIGDVALLIQERPISLELLIDFLPTAKLIMSASPTPDGRWNIKIRLGQAGHGMSLSDLDIPSFDPKFGGRWNAGSNSRGGGTELAPDIYAEQIAVSL